MGKGKNVISINGSKYRELIENASGKTLKEISLENGFSDSFLRMVVKTGKASPTAQAVAKLYGIEPSAYEVKPEVKPDTTATQTDDAKQLSFDDLVSADFRDELKELFKQAIREEGIKESELKTLIKEAIKEMLTELGVVVGKEGAYKKPSPAIVYLKSLSESKPTPKSVDDFNK